MPNSLHRRSFMSSILLVSLAPLTTTKRPNLTKNQVNENQQIFRAVKPLDQDFVSVNGWVLPKKTLIKGTR